MKFPPLSSWMRGRKVVDRARGDRPPLNPAPTTLHQIKIRHGLTDCPTCGEKAAVLYDGRCCDYAPHIA